VGYGERGQVMMNHISKNMLLPRLFVTRAMAALHKAQTLQAAKKIEGYLLAKAAGTRAHLGGSRW
jgi:hypothetical protein